MEKLDVIEFDNKEYLVYEKVMWQENNYYVLCPIENDKVDENGTIVVKEKEGLLYSLDDELEIKEVKKILESLES